MLHENFSYFFLQNTSLYSSNYSVLAVISLPVHAAGSAFANRAPEEENSHRSCIGEACLEQKAHNPQFYEVLSVGLAEVAAVPVEYAVSHS